MTTLLDHRLTLQYLAYLGYPHTSAPSEDGWANSALVVTRPRRSERRTGKVSRNVFLCYVLGAAGSGKTAVLRSFVGKDFKHAYTPTKGFQSVVGEVEVRGQQKYLVVRLCIISDIVFYHSLLSSSILLTASRIWLQL